jgi:hypothetical protein
MTEPEHPSFRQRRLEADERVRRKNLEDRGVTNVVPLKRPKARREFRLPAVPTNPVILWGGIVAILIVVYFIQQAL